MGEYAGKDLLVLGEFQTFEKEPSLKVDQLFTRENLTAKQITATFVQTEVRGSRFSFNPRRKWEYRTNAKQNEYHCFVVFCVVNGIVAGFASTYAFQIRDPTWKIVRGGNTDEDDEDEENIVVSSPSSKDKPKEDDSSSPLEASSSSMLLFSGKHSSFTPVLCEEEKRGGSYIKSYSSSSSSQQPLSVPTPHVVQLLHQQEQAMALSAAVVRQQQHQFTLMRSHQALMNSCLQHHQQQEIAQKQRTKEMLDAAQQQSFRAISQQQSPYYSTITSAALVPASAFVRTFPNYHQQPATGSTGYVGPAVQFGPPETMLTPSSAVSFPASQKPSSSSSIPSDATVFASHHLPIPIPKSFGYSLSAGPASTLSISAGHGGNITTITPDSVPLRGEQFPSRRQIYQPYPPGSFTGYVDDPAVPGNVMATVPAAVISETDLVCTVSTPHQATFVTQRKSAEYQEGYEQGRKDAKLERLAGNKKMKRESET